MPTASGVVRRRLFLADSILGWGDTQLSRISRVLVWVKNNTNIPRLNGHIRPDGVIQLSLRRRMQAAREKSADMNAAQLGQELEPAASQAAEQAKYFDEIVNENAQLEGRVSAFKEELEDAQDDLAKKDFTIQSLKGQLDRAGDGGQFVVNAGCLVGMVSRKAPPSR
jgi:chromosome segregation ATPase